MAVIDLAALEDASRKREETRDLVEKVRAGDLEAFEGIIRLHERRILGMAVQMGLSPADAQDACQEIFIRVFRYLSGFEAGRSFEAWLWRIAVHAVYDALRERRDREEVSWDGVLPAGEGETARSGGLHLSVENADLCAKILGRMGILSRQERMAFVLKEMQDLDTAEVAKAMGISRITVRRHVMTARQKLRTLLRELGSAR